MRQGMAFDIGFIGAGNMATALARGVIRAGVAEPGRVCASDVSPERRAGFVKATGAVGLESNVEAVESSEMVVIAVKPQMVDEVLGEVGKRFVRSQVVVSIAAGIGTGHIELFCGEPVGVVRVMPNTPALVGEGMTAIAPGRYATKEQLERVRGLFEAVGQVVEVEEGQMEAVTAVSGSGPAYFFYMMECLAGGAIAEGLSPEVAWQLTRQTAVGAAVLADESEETVEELRRRVTSPGGTTEAAIGVMNEAGFRGIVQKAVQTAAKRARELGR